MADFTKPNMDLLKKLEEDAGKIDQQQVINQYVGSQHHQVAFVFEFSDDFPSLNLASGQAGNAIGERIIRLVESLNTPTGIKADLFTRTKNNGTIAGVLPGVTIQGDPMPPEEFCLKGKWVLTCYVRANNYF